MCQRDNAMALLGGFITKHQWVGTNIEIKMMGLENGAFKNVCHICGLTQTYVNDKSSCPPWASTGEGENAKQVYEAVDLKELKRIQEVISDRLGDSMTFYSSKAELELLRLLSLIRFQLRDFIEKHEGHG